MWPKLTKKTTDIEFVRLELTESEDVSNKKSSLWVSVLYQLVDFVVVVLQCLLVATICYLFMKMSFILYNKARFSGSELEIQKIKQCLERYEAMFEEFVSCYNKTYTDKAERDYRFYVFVKNVVEFEEEEKKHPGLDLDVTQFADWTEDEMRRFLLSDPRDMVRHEGPVFEGSPPHEKVRRPVTADWTKVGKVAPVKDQGQCGSCWAFATAASVEAGYAIKTGRLTTLSEQEMVDCDSRNNGFDIYSYFSFVKEHGLVKEVEYPYRGTDHNMCQMTNTTERVYISDYRTLSTNEEVVADWIAANGPATFGMNVTKALYSYRSGVFTPSKEDCEEHSLGSHALTIVGYGTEAGRPYWLVKNSWGSRWGQGGYFKLARGVNACGAANNVVAPVM
ncbi:papain family cysteine protease [Ancylostoma caninum]|uniref:Papain family cysteine protease n=1 Tax=Ancylostoma caninum TaxID=29170 RepID=A0A368H7U3_ANCCA|nr:papain family cysteine protease [Ancylostoma caninum]